MSHGTKVNGRENLRPGDVLGFYTDKSRPKGESTHVGIFISGNQFIHAPHSGSVVKYESLDSDYYKNKLVAIRRFT